MLIGILETGRPPEGLAEQHGDYADMFVAMLSQVDPSLKFVRFAALDGDVPTDPRRCDGWLITGSRHGVYEELPWMQALEALIRAAFAVKVPVVGICFGHQIMAKALGGTVVKSDKGWGLGHHTYPLVKERPAWLSDGESFTIAAVHQDQVVTVPASGTVIASSSFCANAAIAYGDLGFSVQGHPEFSVTYQRALYDARKAIFPADRVAAAELSLSTMPAESGKVARWIVDFLRYASAAHRRAA